MLWICVTQAVSLQWRFCNFSRGVSNPNLNCFCKDTSNGGTSGEVIEPVVPTYGERFLDDQKGHVFASELRPQEKLTTTVTRSKVAWWSINAIIYLPIAEMFAFQKIELCKLVWKKLFQYILGPHWWKKVVAKTFPITIIPIPSLTSDDW